ncbi:DoxX family membrane protein [Puniceicoccaceae bacterium K14]|nr:DoxX family membrane protein [Puniceicoccaceae bacterium K14]
MAKSPNPRNNSWLYWSAETWAILALRLFLSLLFITACLGKFISDGSFAFSNYYESTIPHLIASFDGTILPRFLVAPYVYCLAYIQLLLGLALLLGIKTKYTLALFAAMFVSLAFGKMCQGDQQVVNNFGVYLLVNSAALYFVRHNKLELVR